MNATIMIPAAGCAWAILFHCSRTMSPRRDALGLLSKDNSNGKAYLFMAYLIVFGLFAYTLDVPLCGASLLVVHVMR